MTDRHMATPPPPIGANWWLSRKIYSSLESDPALPNIDSPGRQQNKRNQAVPSMAVMTRGNVVSVSIHAEEEGSFFTDGTTSMGTLSSAFRTADSTKSSIAVMAKEKPISVAT